MSFKLSLLTTSFLAAATAVGAAQVTLLTFDVASDQTDVSDYKAIAAVGDIIPGAGLAEAGSVTDGGADTDPHLGAGPGRPDIAVTTVPAGSFQGGGALLTSNANSASGGNDQAGEGLYVTFDPPIADSWTIECIALSTADDPSGAEFGIQDLIGADSLDNSGNPEAFAIRDLGSLGDLQLMTNDNGGGTGEKSIAPSTNPTLQVGTWIHYALVYDHNTGMMELFMNGISEGSVQTEFNTVAPTAMILDDIAVGYYANGAGSNRTWEGYIDAVSVDDSALAPGAFHLPTGVSASVSSWQSWD